MAIDFVEDKEFDFQADNNIDFQPSPIKLEGKVEQNVELSPYDLIMQDNTLTKEQKVQKIKEQGEKERKEIDKQHKIEMAKLYGGAALEIASAAIPFGGAAKLGGTLALKLAKPAFSQIAKRVIVKNIGSGIFSGLASGAMFGAGDALMNNENIVQGTLKGAGEGAIGGGVIGGVAGKVLTKVGKTGKRIKAIENNSISPKISNIEIEETKAQLRDILAKRKSAVDLSKYEAGQKINSFIEKTDELANALGVDPKNLREIMPFIRENTDLPIQNFEREDLRAIYNKLTPEQKDVLKTVAQNNFDDMETYWQELSKLNGAKSSMSPEDYITHIWDMGEEEKVALKNFLDNGGSFGGGSKGANAAQESISGLKTESKFQKRRFVPTFKEGIEGIPIGENKVLVLKPKTLDYAEIQKMHSNQLIEATENTKFFNELDKMRLSDGSKISDIKELRYFLHGIPTGKEAEQAAQTFAGKLIQKAGNAYDTVNNFAKGCKFLFNGMHAVALTESAAAHEGILPFKTIKTLGNLPKIIDGIKNNNYALFKESKLAKQAIADGVQFGAISDVNVEEFNTFMDGFSNILDKVTFGASKIATKPLKGYIDVNNKFLWNYLHNTYKLHTYDTLIKRVSNNGKKTLSNEVRKDIAQLVNDTFGGQNWEGLGIKDSTLKASQRLLLSPDWNMSATIRQSLAIFSSETGQKFLNEFAKSSKFGAASREFSRKLGLSSFTNDVEGAGVRGVLARRYFMNFLIQTAIYSNAINACNRAIDKKYNPEKYENGINYSSYSNNRFNEKDGTGKKVVDTLFPRPYIGNDEYGREIYARIGKQALEVPEIVEDLPNSAIRKAASKTAPLINPVATKISDVATDNWNKSSVGERYKDTFTPFTVSSSKKGFHPVNLFYSTSKGLNAHQARAYLKECILKGDTDAIEQFKPKMKANKIDFDRAIKRVYKEIEEEQRNGDRRN